MNTGINSKIKHFKIGRLHFYNGAKGSNVIAFGFGMQKLKRICWHFWWEVRL